jgi:hypothetical protein
MRREDIRKVTKKNWKCLNKRRVIMYATGKLILIFTFREYNRYNAMLSVAWLKSLVISARLY